MEKRVSKRKVPRIPPELDLTSEFMDPKKVLAANYIQLLFPNAKTYNNLAEYNSHTFLKKSDRKKKVIEISKERNYAWYYSTIGYDPSYGNEYYAILNKQCNNKRRKRKGKKSAHTSITPCEPMRSEKVVCVKSDYKLYCRRKFPKWFKEYSSSYEASLEQESKPRMSLDEFVVRIMESNHVEDTSLPQNNVEMLTILNPRRNVLLKFDKNTDPLSFLKCIIFGKVDIDRPLTISVNKKDDKPPIFELPLPLFAQSPAFVPDADVFLCINVGAVSKNDNSAYETESSGYMSDGSVSTRSLETLYSARYCDRNSIKSKKASKLSKQTKMLVHTSVLKAKENSLALESLSEGNSPLVVDNAEDSRKPSIIVSINRKLITLGNLNIESIEKPQLKENKLPVSCKCSTKISKELSYQCICGFYNNAVNEIRNFKIPRKRTINSLAANIRVNKKARKY